VRAWAFLTHQIGDGSGYGIGGGRLLVVSGATGGAGGIPVPAAAWAAGWSWGIVIPPWSVAWAAYRAGWIDVLTGRNIDSPGTRRVIRPALSGAACRAGWISVPEFAVTRAAGRARWIDTKIAINYFAGTWRIPVPAASGSALWAGGIYVPKPTVAWSACWSGGIDVAGPSFLGSNRSCRDQRQQDTGYFS